MPVEDSDKGMIFGGIVIACITIALMMGALPMAEFMYVLLLIIQIIFGVSLVKVGVTTAAKIQKETIESAIKAAVQSIVQAQGQPIGGSGVIQGKKE